MDFMNLLEQLEEVANEICNRYCKYGTDESIDCDDLWEKHCSKCPLRNVE